MSQYELSIAIVGHDRASSVFRGLGNVLEHTLGTAGGILASRVFMEVAQAIGSMAEAAINATAQFQLMELSLMGLAARELVELRDYTVTVSDVLPQAEIAAKGLMDELSRIAILSPYTVEMVQNTFRMSMAFGFSTDQSKKLTEGLLNMAAGIGASGNMLDRMAYNLAQIRRQGKVTALDVRQLALAGLDLTGVLRYMGKQIGENIEDHLDFNKVIESGKMSWEDFATYFEQYAAENFAGASERMARSLIGLKSTWHDVFVLTLPRVLGPAVDRITTLLSGMLDIFLRVRDSGALEDWGAKIDASISRLITPFQNIVTDILKYFELGDKLKEMSKKAGTEWVEGLNGALVAVETGPLSEEFDAIRNQMGKLVPGGDLLAMVFQRLFGPRSLKMLKGFNTGIDFIKGAFSTLANVFKLTWNLGSILFRGLEGFWDNYGSSVKSSLKRIAFAVFSLGDGGSGKLIGGFSNFADMLSGPAGKAIADFLYDFSVWVQDKLVPGVKKLWEWLNTNLPKAFEKVKTTWDTKLKPSLIEFKGWIVDDLIPALITFKDWLSVKVPAAYTAAKSAWETDLQPALTNMWNSLNNDVIPALISFGRWFSNNEETVLKVGGVLAKVALAIAGIAAVAPVASAGMGSMIQGVGWLATIGSAINLVITLAGTLGVTWTMVGIAAAFVVGILGTLSIAFVQLIAGVTLLVTAWKNNWLGIQNIVAGVVAVVSPILSGLGQIIGVVVTHNVGLLKAAWGLLMQVMQPFIRLATAIGNVIRSVLNVAFQFWRNILIQLFPWLEKLKIVELITGFMNSMVVAVKSLSDFILKMLMPAISDLLAGVLEPLNRIIDSIVLALNKFAGWLDTIATKLGNLKLPGWLTPGSPTPLEMGLWGILRAMEAVDKQGMRFGTKLPGMRTPSSAMARAAATTDGVIVQIPVHVDHLDSALDFEALFYDLAQRLRKEMVNKRT